MIEAVAAAAEVTPAVVRRAAMVAGGIAAVASAALQEGREGLARFRHRAVPADRPDARATRGRHRRRHGAHRLRPSLEWKLDGARVQVHKLGDEVRIYSRTGNDVTAAVPEIVEVVRALPPTR